MSQTHSQFYSKPVSNETKDALKKNIANMRGSHIEIGKCSPELL